MGFRRVVDCNGKGYLNMPRTRVADDFLSDVRAYQLLSSKEEVQLLKAARYGKTEQERINARNRIVEANQRFVIAVAKRLIGDGSLLDAVNEGNIGLIKAIDHFDGTRRTKFISYAVWWVKKCILEYRETVENAIRLKGKQKVYDYGRKVSKVFFDENGRFPTNEEICEIVSETGKFGKVVPEDFDTVILTAYDFSGEPASGDVYSSSPAHISDERLIAACNTEKEIWERHDAPVIADSYLNTLKCRDREIVKRFFGIGCTQQRPEDIGDYFGLTGTRVSQIVEKSIKKMKDKVINKQI